VPRSEGVDPHDETVRLLATLIRLQVGNQKQAILELHKAGLGISRIADVLGTTPGTVNVAVQRAKRAPSRRATAGPDVEDR
jgi:DNA-directed RNA polymerase specialized sigma24 family protein